MKLMTLNDLQRYMRQREAAGGLQRPLMIAAEYALALTRDLLRGELSLRAMSLVYTTLLSLVPLLALGFSVLKALGVHHGLDAVLENFLAPLGPDSQIIAKHMVGFVDNVKVGVLGSLGVGLLLYSAVSLIYKVEASFNVLWECGRSARRGQRFGEYVAVLVIGPTVVFSALGMTASLRSPQVIDEILQVEPFGSALVFLSKLLPYLLMVAVFSFVYGFIPNLRVKLHAAAVGGLFAGLAWQSASAGFATFVARASNYNAIYSGFAILVFLLIWMYLGWLITLLGCRLSFYVQYPERLLPHPPPAYGSREGELLALTAGALICQAFRDGRPAPAAEPMARQLGVPTAALERALCPLLAGGALILSADGCYLPGRDLDALSVATLWLQSRGDRLRLPGDAAAAAFLDAAEAAAVAGAPSVRQWLRRSDMPPDAG